MTANMGGSFVSEHKIVNKQKIYIYSLSESVHEVQTSAANTVIISNENR